MIDDESTNTALQAEKVQTSPQTKAKTEPVARRLETLREEFWWGAISPDPSCGRLPSAWDNQHWVPPEPGRVSINTRLQRRPKAVRRSVESEGLMGREKAGCGKSARPV